MVILRITDEYGTPGYGRLVEDVSRPEDLLQAVRRLLDARLKECREGIEALKAGKARYQGREAEQLVAAFEERVRSIEAMLTSLDLAEKTHE